MHTLFSPEIGHEAIKTFLMLNSTEHEISTAHERLNGVKCRFFLLLINLNSQTCIKPPNKC